MNSTSTTSMKQPSATLEPCSVFWDIENCQVPKGFHGWDIAKKLKDWGRENSLQLLNITAIGNPTSIREDTRVELEDSGISLQICSSGKASAADIAILGEIMKTIYTNRPPYCIVLISGDRDFSKILNFLVGCQYKVVLVHSKDISPVLRHATRDTIPWFDLLNAVHPDDVHLPHASSAPESHTLYQSQAERGSPSLSVSTPSLRLPQQHHHLQSFTASTNSAPPSNNQTISPAALSDLLDIIKNHTTQERPKISLGQLGAASHDKQLPIKHGFANWKDYILAAEKAKAVYLSGKDDRNGFILIALNFKFNFNVFMKSHSSTLDQSPKSHQSSSPTQSTNTESAFKGLEDFLRIQGPEGIKYAMAAPALTNIAQKQGYASVDDYIKAAESMQCVYIAKSRTTLPQDYILKPFLAAKKSSTPTLKEDAPKFAALVNLLQHHLETGLRASYLGTQLDFSAEGFPTLKSYLTAAQQHGLISLEEGGRCQNFIVKLINTPPPATQTTSSNSNKLVLIKQSGSAVTLASSFLTSTNLVPPETPHTNSLIEYLSALVQVSPMRMKDLASSLQQQNSLLGYESMRHFLSSNGFPALKTFVMHAEKKGALRVTDRDEKNGNMLLLPPFPPSSSPPSQDSSPFAGLKAVMATHPNGIDMAQLGVFLKEKNGFISLKQLVLAAQEEGIVEMVNSHVRLAKSVFPATTAAPKKLSLRKQEQKQAQLHRDDDDTSVDGDDSDHHTDFDEERVEQARFTNQNVEHSTTTTHTNVVCSTGTSLQKVDYSLPPFPTTPPTHSLDPSSHLIWSDEVDRSLLAKSRSTSASASTSFSATLLPALSLSLEKRGGEVGVFHDEKEEEGDAHSSTIEMESLVSALVEEDEHDSLHHTLHHLLADTTTTVAEQTDALDLDVVEEASVAAVATLPHLGQHSVLDLEMDLQKKLQHHQSLNH